MLNKLIIKNIALINELEITLSEGMNVLSGETGAGKSIIVDSVNLVLGERADRELIRTGAEKAVVEAWFGDVTQSVRDILDAQQIEAADDLVLSRELSAAGKNVCRVNGTLVTLGVLKSISDALVDIHGQHEHQSLLNEKNHIVMLDSFDARIGTAKADVAAAYSEYTSISKRLKSLFGADGDRERKIDILGFQISEIEQANIKDGEEEELGAQKKRLNASEQIMGVLSAVYSALYESETSNVMAVLKDAGRRLAGISHIDNRYEDMAQKVDEVYYTIEEIAETIRDEMDLSGFDAQTLEETEDRLALIQSMNRKYHDARIMGDFISHARQELEELVNSERLLAELNDKARAAKSMVYEKSIILSDLRKEAAVLFEQKMMGQLKDLGMASARFSVQFADTPDIDHSVFSKSGIDTVEFFISTNRGEPQKQLKKIASGGEVSRIMLALKNIAADKGGIATMIFDEIDTGISGRMAQVVAEKLFSISLGRQVICVTHLPQIASMADKHFLVSKESDETMTRTYLDPLGEQDRIYEVARLSGGGSDVALAHAKEMLDAASKFKTTI